MACPSQNIQAKVPSPPSRSEEHVCPHQSLKRTSDQLGSGDWFGQVTAPQREPLNMSMYELLKSWPLASHHRSELAHTQSRQNPWTRKGFPSTNNIEVCLELIYVSVFHVAVLSSVTVFFWKECIPETHVLSSYSPLKWKNVHVVINPRHFSTQPLCQASTPTKKRVECIVPATSESSKKDM